MNFNLKTDVTAALRRMTLAFALAAGCGMASASVLHVSLDTSGFGAASGYLDLQFGGAGGPLATAVVDHMVGFDSSATIDSWGLTPVSGGYLFRNDTANDLFQAVNFGGTLYFDLTFAGEHDASASFVSVFTVSAFDLANATVGAVDPVRGALATFFWTPSATPGGGGDVLVSVSDAHLTLQPATYISPVPEPAMLYLTLLGLALISLVAGRSHRKSPSSRSLEVAP